MTNYKLQILPGTCEQRELPQTWRRTPVRQSSEPEPLRLEVAGRAERSPDSVRKKSPAASEILNNHQFIDTSVMTGGCVVAADC